MQKNPFDEFVSPHIYKYPTIVFTEQEMQKVRVWAEDKSFFKVFLEESAHLVDGDKELTRNMTGQLGEWAVEKYIGIPFVDWTIGDSVTYNHPDIGIKNVGIKTVEWGKMPVILLNSYYPEIICIRRDNIVYIAGLATADVLNTYQSQEYILDPKLRARGVKTCFYGFDHLQPIPAKKEA